MKKLSQCSIINIKVFRRNDFMDYSFALEFDKKVVKDVLKLVHVWEFSPATVYLIIR